MVTHITRKCDVCGAPATNAARDVLRDEGSSVVKFSPVGNTTYGCDEHTTTSEEHITAWPSVEERDDV